MKLRRSCGLVVGSVVVKISHPQHAVVVVVVVVVESPALALALALALAGAGCLVPCSSRLAARRRGLNCEFASSKA